MLHLKCFCIKVNERNKRETAIDIHIYITRQNRLVSKIVRSPKNATVKQNKASNLNA